jgi:uncharacterized protein
MNIWRAARVGDVGEVERLVGEDSDLLDAKSRACKTPLMRASEKGRTGVVQWLVDEGAAMNERADDGHTALWLACSLGKPSVVGLLLQRGADPTIVNFGGYTPLIAASDAGHVDVVRLLLGNPSARATINHCTWYGQTALSWACYRGRGMVARALLQSGADLTIAEQGGVTPMAIAKHYHALPHGRAEGRRECVAALEVRFCLASPAPSGRG